MSPAEALEILSRRHLTALESAGIFRCLAGGVLDEMQSAALLAALKTRGETAEVLHGAAIAMLEASVPFPSPPPGLADCCGTGGDGAATINISTAAAFVAAEAGLPVAKHGNRAVSSSCGSADLLESAGVTIEMPPERARRCLDLCGLTYLHAPAWHPAIASVAGVRRALGTRTVFNILGPLLNPSRPSIRLVGVYAPSLVLPVARALRDLGCASALVVHGDGLDEIALHAGTSAVRVEGGDLTPLKIAPEDAGLAPVPLAALRGSDPSGSGPWLRSLLAGRGTEAHLSAVAINAGALLWISGLWPTLRDGCALALEILRSGRAAARLDRLVEASRGA